jgi:hypothetical protein
MSENRIVTELYLEKPNFKDVSHVSALLEKSGIKTMLMPPEDRGINVHLVAENADLPKIREFLKNLGIPVMEKEVLLVRLDNKPGTMAEVTRRIAASGVNLTYAFSVAMNPTTSYVLFGSSDNKKALDALE